MTRAPEAVPATAQAGGSLLIKAVETTVLDLPLRRPHRFSVQSVDTQAVLLVRVRTDGGITGIGEGVVPGGPWWGGESIEGMQALVQGYLAPLLVGEDALRADYLGHRLNRFVSGAPFAKAAIEMAVWDACGKATGLPLHRLLGGAHRDTLPVTWALGADPAPQVLAEAADELALGRRSFKLKMGASPPGEDTARIAEIAEALRDRADVAVDLNGAWDEPTASRWLPELSAAGVGLVEQPLPAWNVAGLARLRDRTDTVIMADEALRTPHDAQRLAEAHAADVFALKLGKSGGIGAVRRISAIAEAAGIGCYGGTAIETSVGTAAAAHVYCSIAGLTAGTELFGPRLLSDDIVEGNSAGGRVGEVRLEHGPGLGVALDEDKVSRYARR